MRRFIGIDRAAIGHALTDRGKRLILSCGHERKCLAVTLTHDDDNAALAGLIDAKAAVFAVVFVIGGFDVAAKIAAVDFNVA
jgi:hypothetical protein